MVNILQPLKHNRILLCCTLIAFISTLVPIPAYGKTQAGINVLPLFTILKSYLIA